MSERTRSRAALLPYPGDPFLLNYWLMFFDKFWGAEVDRLYIGFNSPIEETVLNYIKELCSSRPKIILDIQIQQMDHGPTIDRLLDLCNEDYIMLIEDDGFIFKRGVVDLAFSKLESGEFDI